VLQQLRQACWPDLLQHMIEEVQELGREMCSAKTDVSYWVNKHNPEVINFTACILPLLLSQDAPRLGLSLEAAQASLPGAVRQAVCGHGQCAAVFQRLGRELAASSSCAARQSVYPKIVEAVQQHLAAAKTLVGAVQQASVPLLPETKQALQAMIQHEIVEEEYGANQILQSIAGTSGTNKSGSSTSSTSSSCNSRG
jgi:hypothetical protein